MNSPRPFPRHQGKKRNRVANLRFVSVQNECVFPLFERGWAVFSEYSQFVWRTEHLGFSFSTTGQRTFPFSLSVGYRSMNISKSNSSNSAKDSRLESFKKWLLPLRSRRSPSKGFPGNHEKTRSTKGGIGIESLENRRLMVGDITGTVFDDLNRKRS